MSNKYEIECARCNKLNDITLEKCEHCQFIITEPITIKRASIAREKQELLKRYRKAANYLRESGLTKESRYIEDLVINKRTAIINTSTDFLWQWLLYGRKKYHSYRRQIWNKERQRALFEDDCRRTTMDSWLFGSYSDIVYAALSIDHRGLDSYGNVSVILKADKIEPITSALEMNSYHFADKLDKEGKFSFKKGLPPGHLSIWKDTHLLALTKIEREIKKDINDAEIGGLLLHSTGNRTTDDFIELYIFGELIGNLVEKIRVNTALHPLNPKDLLRIKELRKKYLVEIY